MSIRPCSKAPPTEVANFAIVEPIIHPLVSVAPEHFWRIHEIQLALTQRPLTLGWIAKVISCIR